MTIANKKKIILLNAPAEISQKIDNDDFYFIKRVIKKLNMPISSINSESYYNCQILSKCIAINKSLIIKKNNTISNIEAKVRNMMIQKNKLQNSLNARTKYIEIQSEIKNDIFKFINESNTLINKSVLIVAQEQTIQCWLRYVLDLSLHHSDIFSIDDYAVIPLELNDVNTMHKIMLTA